MAKLPDVLPPYASTISTTDSGVLTGSTRYYYLVRAVADTAVSAPSNRVAAFVFGLAYVQQPAARAVTIARSGNDVWLSWPHLTQDVEGNPMTITSYEVWRSTKPYFAPVIGDPAVARLPDVLPPYGSTISTSDSGVLTGSTSYYYLVRAVAGTAVSSPSNRVAAFVFGLAPGSP